MLNKIIKTIINAKDGGMGISMTRSTMREHIFKLLFTVEFHNTNELDLQIRLYMEGVPFISDADRDYISEKTRVVAALIPEIDEKINAISKGWPVSRLGKAELAIMRLAVYEIEYDNDIPVNVAINEAVELAKKYGADNAPSFINGVLAKLVNKGEEDKVQTDNIEVQNIDTETDKVELDNVEDAE